MHDALTGLYNRSAYDFMRHDLDMSRNALLLVDVDKFKGVNDTYGHDVGDLVLKRVAEVLKYSFRSTDLVFRLGGDEFVVIMFNVDSSMRDQVRTKIEQANVMLQKPKDDLPPTSLNVGVAFADRENPEGDIFKDADTALYPGEGSRALRLLHLLIRARAFMGYQRRSSFFTSFMAQTRYISSHPRDSVPESRPSAIRFKSWPSNMVMAGVQIRAILPTGSRPLTTMPIHPTATNPSQTRKPATRGRAMLFSTRNTIVRDFAASPVASIPAL